MAKVTSKTISALERLRGSWEIVGDILIYNPSGMKTKIKVKNNLNFGKKCYDIDSSEAIQCTTFCFGQM